MRGSSLRTSGLLVGCVLVASGVLTGPAGAQSRPSAGPGEALLEAASRGDVTQVTALLKGGAKVAVRDAAGLTPLHLAAARGHAETARTLITFRRPLPRQGGMGTMPGHMVSRQRVRVKANDGRTPLHLAAQGAHADVVKFLILYGADVNATDNAGATPLDLARDGGHQQVADLLLKHGAKPGRRVQEAPAPAVTTQPTRTDPEVERVRVVVRAFLEASLTGKAKAAGECCLARMARTVTKAIPAGRSNRDAVTYTIRSVTVEGASAKAVVRTRNSNIPEPFGEFLVTYAVKRTAEGWRIAQVADMVPHIEPLDFGEDDQ